MIGAISLSGVGLATAFAAASFLLPPPQAIAQGTVLPESVVTATRVPTLVQRIPAGVTLRGACAAAGQSGERERDERTWPWVRMIHGRGGRGGVAARPERGADWCVGTL